MLPLPDLVRVVHRALPQLRGRWEPLQGGTTNLVWRCDDVVIKSYRPARATPLFPNDPQQEAAALAALAPQGFAPQLLAKGGLWLAYAFLPGPCWSDGPEQVAQLLCRLHQIENPALSLRRVAMGAKDLIAETSEMMAAQGLSVPLPAIPDHPPPRACLLHGDPVPGNIVMASGGPVLIDWQCPAWGDPVLDLALFLSPAMQQIYRGRPLSKAEEAAFLAAYPDAATKARLAAFRPVLHLRMLLHCRARAARGDHAFEQAAAVEAAAAGFAL